MPVIPTLGRRNQKDGEFKASLCCIVRPCLKKTPSFSNYRILSSFVKSGSTALQQRDGALPSPTSPFSRPRETDLKHCGPSAGVAEAFGAKTPHVKGDKEFILEPDINGHGWGTLI